MKTDLKEYFRPLFISCKILGMWPTNFDNKENIFDFLCVFPIHIFFWYAVFDSVFRLNYRQASTTYLLFDQILVTFLFFGDIILFVNNFLIRKKVKNMFEDLKQFETKNLRFIKRRNLKLDIFLFTIFIIFLVILEIILIRIQFGNFLVSVFVSRSLPMYQIYFYILVTYEIFYIFRNMFSKINDIFQMLNKRRLNINYIIVLSHVHNDLICFANRQGSVFAVSLLLTVGEVFLYIINMAEYCMDLLLNFNDNWAGIFWEILWIIMTIFVVLCLCYSWVSVQKEVSHFIINLYEGFFNFDG